MHNNLYDAEARVNGIYPIHMLGDPESPPEWLEELCEFIDIPAHMKELEKLPELARLLSDLDQFDSSKELAEAIAERLVLSGRRGFMVHASVCVRRYTSSDAFFSGWGHTQLLWFFCENVDQIEQELLRKACAFHASRAEKVGAA
ncbi:hypothetical protein V6582_05720 [Agrobacterium vitis]|uniref:hypothetical protein n=1 Tax=Agrobacterium vitis TaxID=373 RepID=UPI0012E74008|nr:hypothetical protein [Agrobacterium vitis]MVA24516.1 hypothetical protein [Agrobacterium vitis]